MARGDHIRIRRGLYWHHGIDYGDGTVIHYAGDLRHKCHAGVVRTDAAEFAHPGSVEDIETVSHPECDPPDCVLDRATSRLGEADYSITHRNCEHFAHWCKTGKAKSSQVAAIAKAAGAAVVAIGAMGLAFVVSARGRKRRG